jgi:hypothetical protein
MASAPNFDRRRTPRSGLDDIERELAAAHQALDEVHH